MIVLIVLLLMFIAWQVSSVELKDTIIGWSIDAFFWCGTAIWTLLQAAFWLSLLGGAGYGLIWLFKTYNDWFNDLPFGVILFIIIPILGILKIIECRRLINDHKSTSN